MAPMPYCRCPYITGVIKESGNAVMKGIHDVFPEDVDDEADSISLKKLKKQEAQWNSEKEVLGFHFDGIKKTTWSAAEKHAAPFLTISKWIRGTNKGQRQYGIGAIKFKEFQSVTPEILSHRKMDCLAWSTESSLLS